MSETVLLGYWKARGRAEVARQLMAICDIEWKEKQYTDGAEWFEKDKQNLGIPFPNLPYLIDGDLRLTESNAIYRHILRRSGKREYLGRTNSEEAIVDNLTFLYIEIDELLVSLFWDKDYKSKLEENMKKAKPKLQKINEFYGEKTYALDYPTVSDFLFAEFSYYLKKLDPTLYESLPFLERLKNAINNIEEIKKYYETKGSLSFVEEGDLKF